MSTARTDVTVDRIFANVLQESKRLEKSGHLAQALSRLEQVLSDADTADGPLSRKLMKKVATLCNRLATNKAAAKHAVKYLRTAEQVLQSYKEREGEMGETCFRLTILTYNNWATYHKEKRSYHMSLNYLLRAERLILSIGSILTPDTLELCAKTKLNIAALYSELRRYPESIEFAEQCLSTLQLELNLRLTGKRVEDLRGKEKVKFDNMVGTYLVAFYNIGVSEESQGHRANAVEAYRNAVSIGKRFLASDHAVVQMAQEALCEAPRETEQRGEAIQVDRRPSGENVPCEGSRDPRILSKDLDPVHSHSTGLLSHFSSEDLSDFPLDSPCAPQPPRPPAYQDEQFKYYTPEQLVKLQHRLSKGTGLNFVSADKYFFTKITKTLNVSRDVKFLRPLTAAGSTRAWNKDDEDRRLISDLRLKKHPHKQAGSINRGKEHVSQHIARLTEESLAISKMNEIREKSKMRNKEFRFAQKIATDIESEEPKPAYPPQRTLYPGLFFKTEASSPRHQPLIAEFVKAPIDTPLGQDFKIVKEEIENRMDELTEDLKKIEEAHLTPAMRRARRGGGSGEKVTKYADLAKSAQKLVESKDQHPKKRSIQVSEVAVKQLSEVVDRKRLAGLKVPAKKTHPLQSDYAYFMQLTLPNSKDSQRK